jgi:hypothetical protein
MGRGGVYYQKYLQTGPTTPQSQPVPVQPQLTSEPELANVILTASASSLQDSSANELLQEITLHYNKASIAPIVIGVTGFVLIICMAASLTIWADIALVLVGAVAHALATKADYKRKAIHLDYALEPEAGRAYVGLLQGIEQLRTLGGLWRISSGEVNANTKYNAGAQYSIKRKSIAAKFESPRFISTDAAVYMLNAGPQKFYFLPDRILVYQDDQIGAVSYGSLTFSVAPSNFVETDSVPYDSEIVSTTWRYTNKGGGPDRRFANNPQIPVVRYANIGMQSSGGLNYLIQASNMQKATAFVQAVKSYGAHLASTIQPALPG